MSKTENNIMITETTTDLLREISHRKDVWKWNLSKISKEGHLALSIPQIKDEIKFLIRIEKELKNARKI